jgi:hypothetical protein
LDAIPEIKDISRPPRALVDALLKIGAATLSSELSRQLGIRDSQIRVPRPASPGEGLPAAGVKDLPRGAVYRSRRQGAVAQRLSPFISTECERP